MATDPNFPAGLQIKPSNGEGSRQGDFDVNDSEADIAAFGIAGRVWEAAYAARQYISEAAQPQLLDVEPGTTLFGKTANADVPTVIELGAGAGYGGLHLARCLQQHRHRSKITQELRPLVLLTDLPNVQPLLERNIARAKTVDSDLAKDIDIIAKPCAWGDRSQAEAIIRHLSTSVPRRRVTHILAADLVYFPELLPPLLRSLIWLSEPSEQDDEASGACSRSTTPEIIFTYKVRSLVKEQPFWAVFGSWFAFEPVLCRPRNTARQEGQPGGSEGWRRFGERGSDLELNPSTAEVDSDETDQQVYVFIARRKEDTFGWLAPLDDGALMRGQREHSSNADRVITELDDTFESLLLNSMFS